MKLCNIVSVFLMITCRATAASCEEDERMWFRKVLDRFGNESELEFLSVDSRLDADGISAR